MRRLWLIPLVVLIALGYALFDARSGVGQARRLQIDLDAAHARIDALRTKNERLREEARDLREDPFARERTLREDLGLARPGEILVRIPREESQSPRIP